MPNNKTKGPGRGWHGDSKGHANAGRKGGLASRRGKSKADKGASGM